jgi:hypothetical protein
MEDRKSVPIGSPIEQNEPSTPTGCHTQLSEPIGNKNRITSSACHLLHAGFCLAYSCVLKMETTYSFETSVDFNEVHGVMS